MHHWIRATFAALAALTVAGCYVASKPLISQTNAAWPFTGNTAFKTFEWKEETHVWKESGSGTLARVGDHYRFHPNPESPDAASDDDMDFLLADIGDGYFVAETRDKDGKILLDVLKRDGETVYQFVLTCEAADQKLADQHIIAKYEHDKYYDTCTIDNLDQLRKAFRAKLAAGMVPHWKYVTTH